MRCLHEESKISKSANSTLKNKNAVQCKQTEKIAISKKKTNLTWQEQTKKQNRTAYFIFEHPLMSTHSLAKRLNLVGKWQTVSDAEQN